ncbi:MAG: S1C family serine protease [Chloroflexota bacterium]|nr:S1C family serine protease [Chloroflexota bacterium]
MGRTPTSLRRHLSGLLAAVTLVVALVLYGDVFGATGVPASHRGLGTLAIEGGQVLTAQVGSDSSAEATTADLVTTIAAEVNPAVVTVKNLQEIPAPFGGPNEPQAVGIGSDFILDTAGHVVTNSHVIEGAEALSVQFSDGTTVDATLIGRDAFQDVAVLQIDMGDTAEVPGVVTLGESNTVEFGDTVVAIGTALGEYPNTVTTGSVEIVDRALDTGNGYELANLIQHDAELWPGNSGGPLIDLGGEVIGMNVAGSNASGRSATGSQMGFAIDMDAVLDITEQLIANGEVARPFLGIESALAASGQRVTGVVDGGPAAEAGIEVADVITAVDGQKVDTAHPLLNVLFEHDPGETVTLTVERNGEQQTLDVVLDERPVETP